MSTKETLSYIDENGGDVAGTVFDPGTPVTVDGVPNDATSLDDVPDDPDEAAPDPVGGDSGISAGEVLDTPDIGDPLSPTDVSRGDEVTVRQPNGEVFAGTVSNFIRRDNAPALAEVEAVEGSKSTLVGPDGERAMFDSDVGLETDRDLVPPSLNEEDIIKVTTADGDSVTGYFDGTAAGELLIRDSELPAKDPVKIPTNELASPDAEVARYDANDLLDMPSKEPLPPEEGGLNDIPDTDDGATLARAIRKQTEWSGSAERGHESPISDEKFASTQEVIAGVLDRAQDDELAQAYARRTVIGNQAERANNGKEITPLGRPMNAMERDTNQFHGDRVVRHEMGHGVVQMRQYAVDNNRFARQQEFFPDAIDATNVDEFQQYLLNNPDTDGDDRSHGWDGWAGDVQSEVGGDDFDTNVDNTIGAEASPGDVIQFTEAPDARVDTTQWEVYAVEEGGDRQFDRREVHLRDKQGHTISKEVAGEGDNGETGELRYTTADVRAYGENYSDIDGDLFSPSESRFTSDDDEGVTVDGFRETLTADDWRDAVDNFASQTNRAFYKMHLKKTTDGREEPIKDGYSSTTASEVPSQMHEVFQSDSDRNAERAAEIAELYPRLTGAYLELWGPSDAAAEALSDVEGVTV
jgi:hypothetical protein